MKHASLPLQRRDFIAGLWECGRVAGGGTGGSKQSIPVKVVARPRVERPTGYGAGIVDHKIDDERSASTRS